MPAKRQPEYELERVGFVERFYKCTKCGEVKSEFCFNQTGKQFADGTATLYGSCKPCKAAASREGYRKHPERVENRRLKTKYGISLEERNTLLKQQGGLCALCGKPPVAYPLVVDHDHETGKVRGLIHKPCNVALGLLGDTIEGIKLALAYLEKSQ